VRFAARRGGYHGGVSPQEVLVPIAVLTAGSKPAGWCEAPPAEPAWWRGANEDLVQLSATALNTPPPLPRRHHTEPRQADLFAGESCAEVSQRPRAQVAAPVAWFEAVLASEIYVAQRRLAGRGAPADEQVRSLVITLAVRGGRMSRAGLSQALGMPTFRLGGLVSAAARVLNLDQAQVLRDDGDDVVLDEGLLRSQFALGDNR
jgi:hypothetical protein